MDNLISSQLDRARDRPQDRKVARRPSGMEPSYVPTTTP
jgi:hypothetical protein